MPSLIPANMGQFLDTLKGQLTMAGNHPTVVVFKAHSHMSEVFSPGSPDSLRQRPGSEVDEEREIALQQDINLARG